VFSKKPEAFLPQLASPEPPGPCEKGLSALTRICSHNLSRDEFLSTGLK